MRPGDLIFFRMKKNVRHVGVYLGDNNFIHASSSKGVTMSNLNSPYWYERFEVAKRVVS